MEIGKIKDYFDQEIKYQQALTNKLSKYLTCFEYVDQIDFNSVFDCFFLGQTYLYLLKEENNY